MVRSKSYCHCQNFESMGWGKEKGGRREERGGRERE